MGRKTHKSILFWVVIFLLMSGLALLFPLSGDDWQWATASTLFTNFNGRYLGNFFSIFLTSGTILRAFFKGAVITGVMAALSSLGGRGKSPHLAAVLALAVPLDMFRQNYQWTAGFSNFTIPSLLILLMLLAWRKARNLPPKRAAAVGVLTLPLAFATQFFAEHITLATTVFALIISIYAAKRVRFFTPLISFAGYLAGAVTMFLNLAYANLPGYNTHKVPSLAEIPLNIYNNFKNRFAVDLLFSNGFLNILTVVLLALLIKKSLKKATKVDYILTAFCGLFTLVSLGFSILPSLKPGRITTILAALYIITLTILLYRHLPKGQLRKSIFFIGVFMVLLAGPTLATHTGARCFYIIQLLWALCILLLWFHLRPQLPGHVYISTVSAFGAMLFVLLAVYFSVYANTAKEVYLRDQYIEKQLAAGAPAIEVYFVPATRHIWQPNPISEYTEIIFKRYQGIPQDTPISLIAR